MPKGWPGPILIALLSVIASAGPMESYRWIWRYLQKHAILVIQDGRISERGTHAELVARGGYYSQVYAHQTGRSPLGPLGASSEAAEDERPKRAG